MSKTTATRARKLTSPNTVTKWIPLSALIVKPTVQRPLDEVRAQRIAENLDLSLLGVIDVSDLGNGKYHISDGQHRGAALRLAGYTDELIECRVHSGLSESGEAALFVGLNTFASPRAFDRFRVRVKAADPIAVGVDQILMEFGWRLAAGDSDGCFTAVVAAERVYVGAGSTQKELGPENLRATLGVITEAWGRKPINANGIIVGGLGLFFARYGSEVDRPALVKRLAQYPGGADNYIGKARGIRDFRGGTLPRCVAELTTDLYNKRRSSGKLEDWR